VRGAVRVPAAGGDGRKPYPHLRTWPQADDIAARVARLLSVMPKAQRAPWRHYFRTLQQEAAFMGGGRENDR
jgi:hypothetical protein